MSETTGDRLDQGRDPAVGAGGAFWQVGLLVAAAVVLLDQATKELAEIHLTPGRMVDVWAEGWGFDLVYNDGGAFGIDAPSWIFLVVTIVVVGLVLRNLPRVTWWAPAVAFGLLLAGALGNALDRLLRAGGPEDSFFRGHVVDFIAWGSFWRFNIADAAITVGFALLAIAMFVEERRAAR